MLSYDVAWIHLKNVQRQRRVHMQLELFFTPSELKKRPQIWKNLNQNQREAVVMVLARLMIETVHPTPRRDKDE
jgi:hypothetical protein